ncbi:MAG: hypothetical protein RLZZ196_1677 [Bacteroidota bacterium]|jgi:hypothetical protein
MPVQECKENNKPGYKWGEEGKCYTYSPDNETEKKNAKKKALIQGLAIGDVKMEKQKVSFDYHETLTTDKGKEYLQKELDEGNIVYIISATHFITDLRPIAEKYGIPFTRIFATGSNQKKVEKIKDLNIIRHYDNSNQVKDLIDEQKINVELIKI